MTTNHPNRIKRFNAEANADWVLPFVTGIAFATICLAFGLAIAWLTRHFA
jgi:hypothetical protein